MHPLHFALAAGVLSVPAAYTVAAMAAARSHRDPWRAPTLASLWGLLVAVALLPGWAATSPGHAVVVTMLPAGVADDLLSVRLDALTAGMLLLVTLVGFVLVRFSRSYLARDAGEARYATWLVATLACTTLLVGANHLAVLGAAWFATSLCLHQLLTHFAHRPAAQVAAHKKFLVSRVADLCLAGALGLLWVSAGTLSLDGLQTALGQGLPDGAWVAALLLAGCVVLKSAQLPFHGWLTQVMEAPTPVSALLHAGVVNIGGFVLLRLAFLSSQAPAAQTLLVVVGTVTAVVAGLVMSTRTDIKGALAWSTMAQMGFMLLQCGLGAYPLAFLHLMAHSAYKAHAFLSTGSAVERWLSMQLAPAKAQASLAGWLGAGVASLAGVATLAALLGADPAAEPSLWALSLVLSLALAPLVVTAVGARAPGAAAVLAAGATLLYFGWHHLFVGLVDLPAQHGGVTLRLVVVGGAFLAGFVAQSLLAARPGGAFAGWLLPRLRAGFTLDDLLTRLTFAVWPPRLPAADGEAVPALTPSMPPTEC